MGASYRLACFIYLLSLFVIHVYDLMKWCEYLWKLYIIVYNNYNRVEGDIIHAFIILTR